MNAKQVKADLVAAVACKARISQPQAALIVDRLFLHIRRSLTDGERIELRNFGVFSTKRASARVFHNPRNPEKKYSLPARTSAQFKPSRYLARRVSEGYAKRPA